MVQLLLHILVQFKRFEIRLLSKGRSIRELTRGYLNLRSTTLGPAATAAAAMAGMLPVGRCAWYPRAGKAWVPGGPRQVDMHAG
jgi:hypothetical protein